MVDTIITKNSSAPGVEPAPGELAVGELAVNLADKKLFSKNAAGEVFAFSGGGDWASPLSNLIDGYPLPNSQDGGNINITSQTYAFFQYDETTAFVFYYIPVNNAYQKLVGNIVTLTPESNVVECLADALPIFSGDALNATYGQWIFVRSPTDPSIFLGAADAPGIDLAGAGLTLYSWKWNGTSFDLLTRLPIGMGSVTVTSGQNGLAYITNNKVVFGAKKNNQPYFIASATDAAGDGNFTLDGPALQLTPSGNAGSVSVVVNYDGKAAVLWGGGSSGELMNISMLDVSGPSPTEDVRSTLSTTDGRATKGAMIRMEGTDLFIVSWKYTGTLGDDGLKVFSVRWTGTEFTILDSIVQDTVAAGQDQMQLHYLDETTFLLSDPGPRTTPSNTSLVQSWTVDPATGVLGIVGSNTFTVGANTQRFYASLMEDKRLALMYLQIGNNKNIALKLLAP
jgi:hypothetical protein